MNSNLFQARKLLLFQYKARLPIRSKAFQWPENRDLLEIQTYILKDLEISNHLSLSQQEQSSRSSADPQYEKSFFKALISKLEEAILENDGVNRNEQQVDDEIEIDGSIFQHYTFLLTINENPIQSEDSNSCPIQALTPRSNYITHYYPTSSNSISDDQQQNDLLKGFQSVTLREEGTTISRGTTGLKTWEASLRLASHLINEPDLIISSGSRVLELGSGVGFLGVVCSQLQQSNLLNFSRDNSKEDEEPKIWLTDVEGLVLDRLEETLQLNHLTTNSNVHLSPLNWIELQDSIQEENTNSETLSIIEDISPTIIIAADVVFSPELIEPLCSTLKKSLQIGQKRLDFKTRKETSFEIVKNKALIASTIRNQETYGKFLKTLENFNLKFEIIKLLSPCSSSLPGDLSLFPTSHNEIKDGRVELIEVTLF